MENYVRLTGKMGKYSTYGETNGSAYYFGKLTVEETYTFDGEERTTYNYIEIKGNKEIAKQLNSYAEETVLTVEGKLKSIKDKKTNQYRTIVEVKAIHEEYIEQIKEELKNDPDEDRYSSVVFDAKDLPF